MNLESLFEVTRSWQSTSPPNKAEETQPVPLTETSQDPPQVLHHLLRIPVRAEDSMLPEQLEVDLRLTRHHAFQLAPVQ